MDEASPKDQVNEDSLISVIKDNTDRQHTKGGSPALKGQMHSANEEPIVISEREVNVFLDMTSLKKSQEILGLGGLALRHKTKDNTLRRVMTVLIGFVVNVGFPRQLAALTIKVSLQSVLLCMKEELVTDRANAHTGILKECRLQEGGVLVTPRQIQ